LLSDLWFAAREPNLANPDLVEGASERMDFFERQELLTAQELKIPAEDLLWHAVDAAKIAAIRDGDAHIVKRSRKGIRDHLLLVNIDVSFLSRLRAIIE
jgi:hypothetical protein